MALILLNPGETSGPFGQFSTDQVFGSTGNETAVIAQNGKVTLDGSFNAGGDTVRILGNAGLYTASINGSTLVLTNAGGANIVIPFGVAGATIQFEDATRTLQISGGNLVLGTQTIAVSGPTEVADGSGGGGTPPPPPPPPPSGGSEIFLTPQFDNVAGASGNDVYIADLNQVNGLQVNTLGTGDRVGNQTAALGGNDRLEAQITRGSTYGDGNAPIQPRVNGVQQIFLEALQSDLPRTSGYYGNGSVKDDQLFEILGEQRYEMLHSGNTEVFFNAKDVRGHEQIWSWESNANLTIQDLNTIVTNGGHDDARNTGDITIGMGYTRSDNTQWDASDLKVFFDPDFLLSGRANQSEALYFLLDQDADEEGRPPLDRINVDGLRFRIDGGPIITLRDPLAQDAKTWVNFVAQLQDELAGLKAAGVVPADTTLFVDPSRFETTFNDAGNVTQQIPAIVLKTTTASVITPVGFSQVEDAIGDYNVFGRITSSAEEQDIPISVQIALEKAGNGALHTCDGGLLVVGAMDKYYQGIPVFNVTVYGDESRPSILRYLDSTGGVLDVINISSDNTGFPTSSWARLAIGATNDDMSLIDASAFRGDLELGDCEHIHDLATLIATGGGDITFYGHLEGSGQYSYLTGAGDDWIDIDINLEALDKAGDSLAINTGSGNDYVRTTVRQYSDDNEIPNQVILNNVDINTGEGNDTVWTWGEGNFRINTGSGNDVVYTDNSGLDYEGGAQWIFNVDMGAIDGSNSPNSPRYASTGDLPGVPLQRSLIGGGKLTVTFSGAGNTNGVEDGGVMAYNGAPGDLGEAFATKNGIESTVTIDVEGVNNHYGTQRDINDAIMRAINDHPVLKHLLVAEIRDNNTLRVTSKIDGYFATDDLDISISRPTGNFTTAMINEGQALGIIAPAGSITTATAIGNADAFGNGYGMSLNNEFYSGVDNNWYGVTNDSNNGAPVDVEDYFNNLNRTGMGSSLESDNVINPGTGQDLIVLGTAYYDDVTNGYWSLDGQLYDDASNDVILLTSERGATDKTTIINFQVAGVETYVAEPGGTGILPRGGFDMLNVNAYLTAANPTTLENRSGGNAPTDLVAGTLIDPSEVVILDFISDLTTGDGDPIQLFGGLNATIMAAAINASTATTNYGNLLQNGTQIDLLDNANPARPQSGLIMIQNDLNLGEYRLFQVTWTNDANTAGQPVATVTDRGVLDFGASLGAGAVAQADAPTLANSIDEINFIASVENQRFDGFGINQYGPDSYPAFFV